MNLKNSCAEIATQTEKIKPNWKRLRRNCHSNGKNKTELKMVAPKLPLKRNWKLLRRNYHSNGIEKSCAEIYSDGKKSGTESDFFLLFKCETETLSLSTRKKKNKKIAESMRNKTRNFFFGFLRIKFLKLVSRKQKIWNWKTDRIWKTKLNEIGI